MNEIEPPRILTWNGNPAHYEHDRDRTDTYAEDVARTAAGEPTNPIRWGMGNEKTNVRNGTRVYLLRQKTEPRGIVAVGYVVNGTNTPGPRWDDPSKTGHYIWVVFERVLDANDPLPMETLLRDIPQHDWNGKYFTHRASGRQIDPLVGAQLDVLWGRHLNGVRHQVTRPILRAV
jgi:hypothetical protein